MRICIVDDSLAISEALAMVLRDAGHDAVYCADAASAVRAMESTSFDVALVDLGLPDISGDALAQSLRVRWPGVVIILNSGSVKSGFVAASAGACADGFLEKPFSVKTLLNAVADARKRRDAAA